MKPNFKNNKQNVKEYRINDEITNVAQCRVTGDNIESKIMSFTDAMALAESMEMDIIEINGSVNPPIMRIAAYDKFMYQQKKKAKSNKQHVQQLKEIQLRANIAPNDIKTKVKKAMEFIGNGDKVKIVLALKGRELARREENKRSLFEFISMMSDVAVAEAMPKDEGNRSMVILKPKK